MFHGKMEEYVLWVVALKSLEQNLRMYYGYKALESVELYSIKKSIICLLLSISLFIITNKKIIFCLFLVLLRHTQQMIHNWINMLNVLMFKRN